MFKHIFNYSALFFLIVFSNAQAQNTNSVNNDEKSTFKPSGKLWGYVFGDYFLKVHADELNRGNVQYSKLPKDFNAFAFRRIYLGYDYQISEKFSTQLLLANENDNADLIGERTVYIKAANLRWKDIIPHNDLVIGQTATPIYAILSEKIWGYRSIEKTVTDMRHLNSSNDFGISWQGTSNEKGNFGYNFMLANGTAQRPENNKYKKFYGELYAKFFNQKFIVDLTGNYDVSSSSKSISGIRGFLGYESKSLNGGIEIYSQVSKDAAKDTINGTLNPIITDVTPFAFSVFIRGQILPSKLGYFARFDSYNPDRNFNPEAEYLTTISSDKEKFVTAGIDWSPIVNVHFMPNIWYNSYNSMLGNVSGNTKQDYDLTARMTFYYIFR